MFLLLFEQTKTITRTVTTYNSEVTWVVAVLVLAWVAWYFIRRYLRARSMRRKPQRKNRKPLKNTLRIKNELSSNWLKKGISKKIHAIGIGKLAGGEHCIQIFINDSNDKMFEDSAGPIPARYKKIPLVLVEMPEAVFISAELSTADHSAHFSDEEYRKVIREQQDVIMGGISGANTNLDGNCGTIGYFVRKKTFLPRKTDVYLLSNSHVFVDLKKSAVDEHDLIMQPSPGEAATSRAIGELIAFTALKFDNDNADANHIDAAVAKLWKQQAYQPLIPMIGAVKGFVKKEDVEVGESSRKCGRTTGFTSGSVFSIHLDIRIKYDRTGQEAFFKDQFLIKPDETQSARFVGPGDSGSLVVDENNYATGLIFAGAGSALKLKDLGLETIANDGAVVVEQLDNYGVANPISEVLSKLNLELL
jgi:hypothetical protein